MNRRDCTKLLAASALAAGIDRALGRNPRGYATGSSGGATFDYYVSPTGNDANAGTLASPWAITSTMMATQNAHNVANFALTRGKRIGFLPGTYNVAAYMDPTSGGYNGALQIDSGTSAASTYYGSSNSSGFYQQGTATLTALTGGGESGGGLAYPANGPILQGCMTTPHTGGWVIVDGLNFTAYSYKAVRIGGFSSGYPAITGNIAVQNCTFNGQFFQASATQDNASSIWIDGAATVAAGGTGNYLVTNNYIHDNNNTNMNSPQHLCAIFIFSSANVTVTNNTVINAGTGVWGKDYVNQGNTIAYNYFDVSQSFTGSAADAVYGVSDFTGTFSGGLDQITTGLTLTTNVHHNIIITNGWGLGLRGAANNESWITPVNVYNNTIVMVSGGDVYPAIWVNMYTADEGEASIYNNIITGVADASGYKHIYTSAKALSICDYNGEPSSTMSWSLGPPGQGNSVNASYTSQSAFAAGVSGAGGISGAESHSVFNNTPGFTGTGAQLAIQYQLAGGSPFKGVGSTTGTTSGSDCDMGAWGGASVPTQIGCTFGP